MKVHIISASNVADELDVVEYDQPHLSFPYWKFYLEGGGESCTMILHERLVDSVVVETTKEVNHGL